MSHRRNICQYICSSKIELRRLAFGFAFQSQYLIGYCGRNVTTKKASKIQSIFMTNLFSQRIVEQAKT